jgi:hypothetical protein
MADKKLNDLTAATDAAYVYAEDASGNQVKISKASLASVVGELLVDATADRRGLMPKNYVSGMVDNVTSSKIDFNTYVGKVPVLCCGSNSPTEDPNTYFFLWQMRYYNGKVQIAASWQDSYVYFRVCKGSENTWSAWKSL